MDLCQRHLPHHVSPLPIPRKLQYACAIPAFISKHRLFCRVESSRDGPKPQRTEK